MDRTAELEVCIKNIIQSGEALPSASFWRSDDRSSEFISRSDDRSSEIVGGEMIALMTGTLFR